MNTKKIALALEQLLEKLHREATTVECRRVKLAATLGAVGRHFFPGRELMVVGKATNGWDHSRAFLPAELTRIRCNAIVKHALNDAGFSAGSRSPDGLRWVREDWRGEKDGEVYSKTAFWWRLHDILLSLGVGVESDWYDKIVWTNFYKIAPVNRGTSTVSGNPAGDIARLQEDPCLAILRAELEAYEPRRILLVTGWHGWWWDPRRDEGKLGDLGEFRRMPIRATSDRHLVAGTLRMGKLKSALIVTRHPQGATKIPYVADVVQAFQSLARQ